MIILLKSNGGFCVYNRKSLKPPNTFHSTRNPLKIGEYITFFRPLRQTLFGRLTDLNDL